MIPTEPSAQSSEWEALAPNMRVARPEGRKGLFCGVTTYTSCVSPVAKH